MSSSQAVMSPQLADLLCVNVLRIELIIEKSFGSDAVLLSRLANSSCVKCSALEILTQFEQKSMASVML